MESNKLSSSVVTGESPRLLDRVRDRIRVKHYSLRTETAYLGWIKRYIVFHGKRHPLDIGKDEVEAFLSHLAVERDIAAATQNRRQRDPHHIHLHRPAPWRSCQGRGKRRVSGARNIK